MAYSKLHSSLVNSSLWTEADHVRLLFITLLALCDKDGCVYGSRSGLARAAMIDPDACDDRDPWLVLMSPDPESCDRMRAPEHEGRRIEEISGGFRLLNFEYYRGLRNDDDRREQNRLAQARFKAKVSQGKPAKASISPGKPPKAHTEAETEAETEAKVKPPVGQNIIRPNDISDIHWRDWIAARKTKRAGAVTETALLMLRREADKAGITADQAVEYAAGSTWVTFKNEYYQNLKNESRNGKQQKSWKAKETDESLADAMNFLTRRQNQQGLNDDRKRISN